jgi:phthalate 4,5-dioxygenase oxygenase subunit
MLSRQDNERMCRVGPGTAMGDAMRRFWVPVLSSHQLAEPDGPPVKVEVLGEKFVAFRNSDGVVGVVDHQCCHRNASLTLGRVEDCGIRCLFHGWLFAPDGTILETPNVSDPRFKSRFRLRAYPVREAGGFIWCYFGPKEKEPPFPHWRYFDYPDERRLNVTFVIKANYVGFQEALLDSSHLTLLHRDAFSRTTDVKIDFTDSVSNLANTADPKIGVEETDFGFHYAAMRPKSTEDGDKIEARVTSYVAPFHCVNANGDVVGIIVPIDDDRTLHHFVWWSDDKDVGLDPQRRATLEFTGLTDEILHGFGLHYDTWHEAGKPSPTNNFRQDREAMKNGAFTGLPIFIPEDAAMMMSCGPIRDRTRETLAPGDLAIARLYRTLLGLADAVARGEDPPVLEVDLMRVRGLTAMLDNDGDWRDLVPEHQAAHQVAAVPA